MSDAPAEPAPAPAEKPRPHRRWLWAIPGLALVLLAYQGLTWPDVAALAEANPESTAFLDEYRRTHRNEDGGPADPAWSWVSYGNISPALKRAVVAAEDLEFFGHDGFSRHEIRQALKDALEDRRPPRGASTLTQQLAKNLWLSPSRNPWRKAKEALLTRQLEKHLEKRRILELYLNVVEFGPGVYGAEAAARTYFRRPAAALTPGQAAALAAALPNPRSWHPGSGSKTAKRRTAMIRERMRQATWLEKVI